MIHQVHTSRFVLAIVAAGALSACGGGGGDSGTSTNDGTVTPASTTTKVSGVLVKPETVTASSARLMTKYIESAHQQILASSTCASVPTGYAPLSLMSVNFRDRIGKVLATLTTDDCGNFSGDVPNDVTDVNATPAGSKPITQPVSVFTAATPAVASAMPSAATLIISVLQDLGNGQIALTVTDSVSGKPVLGLDASNFSFKLNNNPLSGASLSYGASTAQKASVSVVLDASGSMYGTVGTTGKKAIQLASYATHELLGGLTSGSDEAGIVIFDNRVTTIDTTTLADTSRFKWGNASGASASSPYALSASGLTTTMSQLRPIADLYNPSSQIYYTNRSVSTADAVHADTGTLRLLGGYPWGGSTAFYNATSAGLTQLAQASNTRKIVVAMTDGEDNASSKSMATVITEAKTAGVPLYTVAFGTSTSVDETSMQKMAQDTGGEYKRVEGADLTGLFQSIQIGIRFQYVSKFSAALASGSTLETTVNSSGVSATRSLVVR